jgi:hypothetical protein
VEKSSPTGTISLIEYIFKAFLWGGSEESRKINWIKWEKICKAKDKRGLGIRDLRVFNIALLGKWWWRVRNDKESLWYLVLEKKYGSSLNENHNSSSIW